MKLIVAGGRDFADRAKLDAVLSSFASNGLIIISGMARGADMMAYEWAKCNDVPCKEFPAQWETYGKQAGFLRNAQMANEADQLLAFWDGKSSGTKHMIMTMIKLRKRVTIEGY